MKIIGAGIILKEKRILLIKRSKNKPINNCPNFWSIPGGKGEINETPEKIAIREVKEETGLNFYIKKLFIDTKTDFNHFFNFLGEVSGNIIIQEEECDGYGRFTYEEAIKLLINERIDEIIEKLHNENLI